MTLRQEEKAHVCRDFGDSPLFSLLDGLHLVAAGTDTLYANYKEHLHKSFVRPFIEQALGDSIAWCSFILNLRDFNDGRLRVNKLRDKDVKVIREVFYDEVDGFEISKDDEFIFRAIECYNYPFRRNKFRWRESSSETVCYQFDSEGSGHDKKFASEEEKDMVREKIAEAGLLSRKLSDELTLEQCMEELANCKYFVGICSGMSHLAHLVGTPIHLICNSRPIPGVKKRHWRNTHGPVFFYQSPDDFVATL